MSKDKGRKDQKKAPGGKSSGKVKVLSAYKSEGGKGQDKDPALNVFATKTDVKAGDNRKP